ncbi:MAG: imidazole glycerol phosphate synthase subunit HisH [Longimicrobiales bacterium]|nr:imidazole glycerol phosphate synthase subunit HisH [Longimicrobiales bacterium]
MKLALFDYGAGNLHSLGKALEAAQATVTVTSDWDKALRLDGLVLPGVGAFGPAARALPDDIGPLRRRLEEGYPCLGICLGMQLLFDASDESDGHGIGLVPGRVRHLESAVVPHMGWNDVETAEDPIFDGIEQLVAYYANSYICEPVDSAAAIAWSTYEGRRFAAGLRAANTWGLQYHPEKSSLPGRQIITNFVRLAAETRQASPDSVESRA